MHEIAIVLLNLLTSFDVQTSIKTFKILSEKLDKNCVLFIAQMLFNNTDKPLLHKFDILNDFIENSIKS